MLKDRFGLEERIGLERFARATEGNFNAEEGRRLFEHWSDDGRSVPLAAVIADLETTVVHERALFAHYNTGGSLDPVPRSAFPKAQIESNDSPHKNAGEGSPYSELLYEPASIERRPLTAAQPAVPAQPGHREAGLSLVAAVPAHPSCTSVEGGIFSRQFTHAGENAAANDPLGGNRSNLPSLRGGIFAHHSNEPALSRVSVSASNSADASAISWLNVATFHES